MIPFALEEHIAGDLDQQRFAVGSPKRIVDSSSTEGLQVPVVVIRRETVDKYLEALRNAGLEPIAMHLDESLVAAKPGDVIAWLQGEEVFLRTPSGLGMRCAVEDLGMTLDLMPSDLPYSSLGLQIFGLSQNSTDRALKLDELETRFSRVQTGQTATPILDWLVAQRSIAEPINLLQSDLAPRRRSRGLSARWRLPAALAAGLFALVLINHGNTWRIAAAEEKALDLSIAQAGGYPGSDAPIVTTALRQALVDLANSGVRDGAIASIAYQSKIIRITLNSSDSPEAAVRSLRLSGWRVDAGADDQGRVILTLINAEAGT
jgi:type II secretory pathway component PulL